MDSLAKQSARIFGPPPPKDAPKVEAWIFVRRIYTRLLVFLVPLWILISLADVPLWLKIVFGISAVTWLCGFMSVNTRIRKLRSKTPGGY